MKDFIKLMYFMFIQRHEVNKSLKILKDIPIYNSLYTIVQTSFIWNVLLFLVVILVAPIGAKIVSVISLFFLYLLWICFKDVLLIYTFKIVNNVQVKKE